MTLNKLGRRRHSYRTPIGPTGSGGSGGGGGGPVGPFAKPKLAVVDYSSDMSNTRRDMFAKYPIVVINRSRGQLAQATTFNNSVRAINPSAKIYQYVILNEEGDNSSPTSDHFPFWQAVTNGGTDGLSWWVKDAATQNKTQWTSSFGNYELNITNYTTADSSGKRVPQVRADFYWTYYLSIFGSSIDGVFQDNLFWRPRHAVGLASNTAGDYNRDGSNDSISDPTLQSEYRASYTRFWDQLKTHRADLEIISNTDVMTGNLASVTRAEFTGKCEGALLEALSGKSYSVATYGGISEALKYYRSAMSNVKAGGFVMVNAYIDKNATLMDGERSSARYGLALSMLDDGHFTLCDDTGGVTPAEIDEFNWPIGDAVDAPPASPLSNGMWLRVYENGCVVLNPAENGGTYFKGRSGRSFTLRRVSSTVVEMVAVGWTHGLSVGDQFRIIRNRTKTSFNGTFTVTSVPNANTIRWSQSGASGETDSSPDGTFGVPATLNLAGQGYYLGEPGVPGVEDSIYTGNLVTNLTLFSGDAVLLMKS